MSVDKRKNSSGLLDQVYGDDTEAFLDELVNDDFSDWHNFDNVETETAKQQNVSVMISKGEPSSNSVETDQRNASEVLQTNINNHNEPARKVKEAVKGESPLDELAVTKASSHSPQHPQRKWTRFPQRTPEPSPCLTRKIDSPSQTNTTKESVGLIENDILKVSDQLWQMTLEQQIWEEEQERNFEDRHKKMERYLKNLQLDGKEGNKKTDEKLRRSSGSSVDSTTTSGSSSSFSQSDQNNDLKYSSACTVEELIDHKMKDVEDKFNSSICDAWVDDVELALLLIKKKSKRTDVNNNEVKNLLNDILEQK